MTNRDGSVKQSLTNVLTTVPQQNDRPIEENACRRVSDGIFFTVGQTRKKQLRENIQGTIIVGCLLAVIVYLVYRFEGASAEEILFFSIINAIVLLYILILNIIEIWPNFIFHPAELVFLSYPLQLRKSHSIYYRRRLRTGTFKSEGHIEASLKCEEWVEYKQGTETRHDRYLLHEQNFPVEIIPVGEKSIDYGCNLVIPESGPPCFWAKHNRIRWMLTVSIKAAGIPRTETYTFYLKVIPEIA